MAQDLVFSPRYVFRGFRGPEAAEREGKDFHDAQFGWTITATIGTPGLYPITPTGPAPFDCVRDGYRPFDVQYSGGTLTDLNEASSAERRVGQECVSTRRSRWSPCHASKNSVRSSIVQPKPRR